MSGTFFGCCASVEEAVVSKTVINKQIGICLIMRFAPFLLFTAYRSPLTVI